MPRVQNKRGTAANLTSVDPTPLAGELLVVTDENTLKIGNGTDAYTSLAYVTATPRSHTHLFSEISDIFFPSPLTDNSTIVYTAGVGWSAASSIGKIGVGSQPIGGWPTGSVGAALAAKANVATTLSGYGITDAVGSSDARLSDARTPTDGSVTTAKIADDAVTYAKIQNVSATDRLLGRSSAGAGDVQEITCTAFGRSLIDDADAAAGRATLAAAPAASPTFTGVVTVAAGSATAPALVASGDSNTGILFPAADTVAISTGGVERLRVEADGRMSVGAGGSATANGIQINRPLSGSPGVNGLVSAQTVQSDVTSGANVFRTFVGTQASAFTLANLSHFRASASTFGAGSTVTQQIGFHADNTITGAGTNYGFRSDIADGTSRWNFYALGTAPNYVAGNVGIGASRTTPATALDVNGDVTITDKIIHSGDTNTAIRFADNDTVTVETAGSERVRVDSSGNVGIHTTSPTAKLDISGDTLRLRTARTPASAGAAGNAGDICWDADYLYVCTATNTWRRIAHSTW